MLWTCITVSSFSSDPVVPLFWKNSRHIVIILPVAWPSCLGRGRPWTPPWWLVVHWYFLTVYEALLLRDTLFLLYSSNTFFLLNINNFNSSSLLYCLSFWFHMHFASTEEFVEWVTFTSFYKEKIQNESWDYHFKWKSYSWKKKYLLKVLETELMNTKRQRQNTLLFCTVFAAFLDSVF